MGFWDSVGSFMFGGMGKQPDPNASKFTDQDYITNQIKSGIQGAQNRQAPQAGNTQIGPVAQGQASTIDQGRYNDWRTQQMNLAQQLGQVASGQQAGAGELAVQRQIQQGLAGQQAQARMARGGANPALAFRNGAAQSAALASTGAGMGQQAAMQDQANARAQLAGVLGQGAGQDIGIAQGNAQLQQQMNLQNLDAKNQAIFQQAQLNQSTSLANMQARLQTMGLNDQQIQAYMQQLLGMDQATLAARMQQEQASMNQQGFLGDLLSAGGTVGAALLGRPSGGGNGGGGGSQGQGDNLINPYKPY